MLMSEHVLRRGRDARARNPIRDDVTRVTVSSGVT